MEPKHIEPVLVDILSSDESVTGGESSEVDALWWEVGELLEQDQLMEPLLLVDHEKSCASSAHMQRQNKRVRIDSEDASSVSTDDGSIVHDGRFGGRVQTRKEKVEDEIKREIRMARNRASAERTRLRRLEHIKTLEIEAARMEHHNEQLRNLLSKKFNKSDDELVVEGVERMIDVCTPATPARRTKCKKTDASEVLRKLELEADRLPAEEITRLRKEARMARNRASAERTRLRRLEVTRQLEVRVSIAKTIRDQYIDMLREVGGEEAAQEELEKLGLFEDLLNSTSAGSSSDEERASLCAEHEVVPRALQCKTGPAWSSLYIKKSLFSPNLLFLVTCIALLKGLVVSVQRGSRCVAADFAARGSAFSTESCAVLSYSPKCHVRLSNFLHLLNVE